MKTVLESLKEYFANTPRKQTEADWLDSKKDESQSVTIEDYINLNNEFNAKNSENK